MKRTIRKKQICESCNGDGLTRQEDVEYVGSEGDKCILCKGTGLQDIEIVEEN